MEIVKNFIKKLRKKDGISYPFVVCIVLVLLVITFGVCEVIRVNIIAANVRNKFQEAVISETTDNYIKMYQPLLRDTPHRINLTVRAGSKAV